MKRILARALLPVVVLLASVAGTVYLVASKPGVEPAEHQERVWTVSAQPVVFADVQPKLSLFGQIVAGREVELRALVAGEVVATGANLVGGGIVRAGDLLVAIDDFDYVADVDERQAQLREAKSKLDELTARRQMIGGALEQDRKLLTLRQRDVDRADKLAARGNVSDKAVDTANIDLARQRQTTVMRQNELTAETARIEQQQAIIERQSVALRRAERDLKNTRLTAPFDGYLVDVAAEMGKRLNVNDRVADLIDAGRLEARVTVSDAQFGRLVGSGDGIAGRPVDIVWRIGRTEKTYPARLDRVAARIDAASGGVDLFARLNGTAAPRDLRPGAFVEVRVNDQLYRDVAQVPEYAVYDTDKVYVVVDDRLQERAVDIVAYRGDDVLLRGDLAAGDRVVTTRYTDIGPGQRVEVR